VGIVKTNSLTPPNALPEGSITFPVNVRLNVIFVKFILIGANVVYPEEQLKTGEVIVYGT